MKSDVKNSHWKQCIFKHARSRSEATEHVTEGHQPLATLRTLRALTQMLTQTQMSTTHKRRFKHSKAFFETVSWLQSSNIDIRSHRHTLQENKENVVITMAQIPRFNRSPYMNMLELL